VKQILILICSFWIFIPLLDAQTSSDEATVQAYGDAVKAYNDAVQQLQRSNLRSQKRQVIKKAVSLTPEQSRKFWPINDKYEAEVKKVTDTRLQLIADYMSQQSGISAEKATELINEMMQIQMKRQEMKRAYVKEIGTVLTAKQALRLLLLENQIDLQIEAQIAAQIPL
jgi:hypothetical protein